MTSVIRGVGVVLLALLLFGCGVSNEQIGETVKTSMQETFSSDPTFKAYNMRITSVIVVKESGNIYQGIARVMHEGVSHSVPVKITADGQNVMWEAEAGAFLFLAQAAAQKEMEKFRVTSR